MRIVAALFLMLGIAGCAVQSTRVAIAPPPMEVPATAMVATAARPIVAAQVLTGDDQDLFTARAEKVIFGAQPVAALTAYTIYTYDSERISSFWGGAGYRTRVIVQQGFSGALPP